MFRIQLGCSDDIDEDFLEENEAEWEEACCEDPYWDEEEDEHDWCD